MQPPQEFADSQFPPETKSLINMSHTKLSKIESKKWKNLQWIRSDKLYPSGFELIGSGNPEIQQGIMKNTYMQCALLQLYQYPTLIQKIFINQSPHSYTVQVFTNGQPSQLVIDDLLPYDNDSSCLAFTRSNSKHLWAPLLEKSWAKLNGTYESIHSSHSYEVIRAFTGLPYEILSHESIEGISLWNKLIEAESKKYMISGSELSNEVGTDEVSFTIQKLIYWKDDKGIEHRLLMLSNQMKLLKWEGKWSSKSDLWTEEAKKKANYKEDPTNIYMELEDYVSLFKNSTIFRIVDGAKHKALNANIEENQRLIIGLRCPTKCSGCVIISQSEKRFMCTKYQNYESSNISILVGKNHKDTEYIGGITSLAENIIAPFESDMLDAGEYIFSIEANWEFAEINNIVVSAYFATEVDISILDQSKYPDLLSNILTSCATKVSSKKLYDDKDEMKIWKCISINDTKANYGYIYYCNQSATSTLVESYKFATIDGLEIVNYKGDKLDVNVPPNTSKLIIIKKLKPTASFNASYQSFIQKSKEDLMKYIENDSKVKLSEFRIFDELTNVYLRVLSHDFGYLMKITNKNTEKLFDALFTFTLDNLLIDEGPKWPLRLLPGASDIKFLKLIDVKKQASYKYSCTMQMIDYAVKEEEILKKLKTEDIKQLSLNDKPIQAFYNILLIGDSYYWYFENCAEADITITLKFEVENLVKIEEGEIILKSGDHKIIKQGIIDQSKPSSYKVKITYICDSKEVVKNVFSKKPN